MLHVEECNSSCLLCLAKRQLQVATELRQHVQMSKHCVMDVTLEIEDDEQFKKNKS